MSPDAARRPEGPVVRRPPGPGVKKSVSAFWGGGYLESEAAGADTVGGGLGWFHDTERHERTMGMNTLHVLVAIAVLVTVAGAADRASAAGKSGMVCPFLAMEQTAAKETAREAGKTAGKTAGKVTKKGGVAAAGEGTREADGRSADRATGKTPGKGTGKATGKTASKAPEKAPEKTTEKAARKPTERSIDRSTEKRTGKATQEKAPRRSMTPAARPEKGLKATSGDMHARARAQATAGRKFA